MITTLKKKKNYTGTFALVIYSDFNFILTNNSIVMLRNFPVAITLFISI